MKDTDLDRFGELSGTAQIAVAQLVNALASLGLPDDWEFVEAWDGVAAIVDHATNDVRAYDRALVVPKPPRPKPHNYLPLPVLQARARRLMEG